MTLEFSWKDELKAMITDPLTLLEKLNLDVTLLSKTQRVDTRFPLRVTLSFLSRMRKGDFNDPLLKQVLPLIQEENTTQGFVKDPLEESRHNPVPGLLHKYQGRVLLTVTGSCAIHCRYCFRRHFPYIKNVPNRQLNHVLDYIESDTTIQEVILSGGDPFMVNDAYLAELIMQLANIKHLKVVRFHSRLPIVLPSRITTDLIKALTHTRLQPICVIHCNHAQEIDDTVQDALKRLAKANIRLFNQSVLLRDINDDVEILKDLSYRLFDCGVLPYYLHQLDKVEGSAHFEVSSLVAKKLYYDLRARLPGYLVPLLVQEKSGEKAKSPMV